MLSLLTTIALADPPRGPDFDGDGYQDLAVGVPYENFNGTDAGSVVLLYGSNTGLDNPADRTLALWQSGFDVDGNAVEGASDAAEYFGQAVAWGDFNGDCFDDLAVGVPGTVVAGDASAGVVHIFYGSATGPSAATDHILYRDLAELEGSSSAGDEFGATLAAGDLDGDGADDLLVGVPGYDSGFLTSMGAVHVIYGTPGLGLIGSGDFTLTQSSSGLEDAGETNERFGHTLTTGDFNCDGFDDAAIGVFEAGLPADAGAVQVVYGRWDGFNAVDNDQLIDLNWLDANGVSLLGAAAVNGRFGKALVSGNLDGDFLISECDELIVGSDLTVSGAVGAGAAHILMGDPDGLVVPTLNQVSQSGSIIGSPEGGDSFGDALAVGAFEGFDRLDLAVGVMENVSEGAVHVIRGTSTGYTTVDNQLWTRAEVGENPVLEDEFGHHLTSGDYDADGQSDLVVGGDLAGDGSGDVSVLYASDASSPLVSWFQIWTEDLIGATSTSAGDGMGRALVAARRADTCP
ncbi:MAG: hypothetical protein ABMA64_01475 [Myxococcota bacterium]